ncbi:uncharacterized protein NFIA_003630 [Aspergillus fischeri NRRL 181]|uniref:Serine protein kinase n=1 Tax=Neosartorya fischeri (strain ATCC 1020 / DSM 3700 / CBS 544.65 / FGSC A1164 / JCM 1740 / NRRL 181 / WB 181) TaxID=331117 RepID=A1DJW8_NEOFI|nr:uncharacterized protein NFIA_003630 [Aspergillus fischeri NRRL 181]EAW17007.1 hypothetical protein NFIA_003630 [Aspergillus fischeri NRRL 181]KAG2019174.1 hypothetical protein GB937_005468 [Aspergillus fischeri]
MPDVLPDPDIIRYPLHDATLILSVSEDPISPQTGVKAPLDIYCERFMLNRSISATNASDDSPARFGIFTRELLGLENVAKALAISLSGADGKDHDYPNGYKGGVIDMYVEDLSVATARGLSIQARGGRGYTPLDQLDAKVGENGGNGGDGGQVSVIAGVKSSDSALIADRILDHLADSKKRWPADFWDDITEFISILEQKDVKVVYEPPSNMKTTEDIRKVQLSSFRTQVRRLRRALGSTVDDLHVALSNAVDVHGGMYGTGSRGSEKPGKSGQQGKDQRPIIAFTVDVDALLQTKVCYAHPIQCRMLLDKAKLLFWSGSLDNKAQSTTILQHLQERLKPFLMISGPSSSSVAQSPLVQAYREAEPRLCIVSDKNSDIPVSVKRLTSLTSEAEMTLKHIMSGVDFYGKSPDEVPRGSFTSYHNIAEYFLGELEFVENTYKDWFNNGSDAIARLNAIRNRGRLCDSTTQLKNRLIQEAISDLDSSASTIESLTDAFPAARQAVLDEAAKVAQKIKEKFTFSFDELVSAISQVLFVQGNPAMVALQTVSLLDKGLNDIEKDDGILIPKKYLLSKLHRINGSFESLHEGYKVLDGRIQLTDPGAEKLIADVEEFERLLSDFEVSLGDDILKGLKQKFQTYIIIVSQRNAAVVRYNSDLTLLVQYHRELDSLEVEKNDLVRDEYENLGADHPSMTAFMKKTNQDAVQTAQLWLYKQERAYSFVALSDAQIIGEALKGVSVSQYNLTHLRKAQAALYERYNMVYKEKKGQPPQTHFGAKFMLEEDDVEDIKESGKKDIMLLVDVPPTADVFNGKADVRLTKVRFFAKGAKTDNHRLEVKLTHTGKETIVNNRLKRFYFRHDPLKVTFRYNTESSKAEGDDVVDGNIAWPTENDFALPGPFTQWKIEIRNAVNKNMDLSGVQSSYLEFDYQFQSV